MSGVPGLRSPLARGIFSLAMAVENFGRWWNREPTLARRAVVRGREPTPFGKINDRDRQMGFEPARTYEEGEVVGDAIGRVIGQAMARRARTGPRGHGPSDLPGR